MILVGQMSVYPHPENETVTLEWVDRKTKKPKKITLNAMAAYTVASAMEIASNEARGLPPYE